MKKVQQGRSMIEMLGVLAIIGVLSIGGLAGYTMAMNRHRANTVLDYATKCGVIAQTQGDGSAAISEEKGDCSTAAFMGANSKPGVDKLTSIKAKRDANAATKVTVSFSAKTGVTQAIASRLGLDDAQTFTLNVDEGKWSVVNGS